MLQLVRPSIVLLGLILSWSALPVSAAATAELLVDIETSGGESGSSPYDFIPVSRSGFRVVFGACDNSEVEVWSSDGTEAGTFPLPGVSVPCGSSDLPQPVASGELGFYLARSAGKLHLWRTDGTAAGTFRLTPDRIGAIRELTPFGEGVAFLVGNTIWQSDGSLIGARPLVALPVEAVEPHFLKGLDDWIFFVARNGSSFDEQLWMTDGTETGTIPLTDFHTLAFDAEAPPEMAKVGSTAFFVAENRLWKTNGTAAGTQPVVASFNTGAFPSDLVVFKGALYFMGDTNRSPVGRGLWRSNGTAAGTELVGLIGTPAGSSSWLTVAGDRLFFSAGDGVHGTELWVSDGTDLGTSLVRDIAPGAASSQPAWIAAAGSQVFFSASNGANGTELWRSDGTELGTWEVQDISPGASSSHPEELTLSGGNLYFSAFDGFHGEEPWVLDLDGEEGCVPSSRVLCLGGGRFRVEADWRAQGQRGDGRAVTLTADTGYFWFFDASNVEVIVKVLDGRGVNGYYWVFYGALSNVQYALTVTDTETGVVRHYENPAGRLASVAHTEAFGPWTTGVGELSAEPLVEEPLVASWLEAAEATCAPSSTRLCLNNGRFAVEARWSAQGNTGTGQVVALPGGDTGYFWFFDPDNVEVVVKVLDGRTLNDKFWVFYGALSDVEYTLTVTDTVTGAVKTYTNPKGRLASVADTGAF
jgi:ELWxxDGT repeat protein